MKYAMPLNDLKRMTGMSAPEIRDHLATRCDIFIPAGEQRLPSPWVKPFLESLGVNYEPHVIAFINLKGGVGKTISSISTASRAVQYGYKTCLLDLDSQGSASLAFDCEPGEDDPIFVDIWQKPGEMLPTALRRIEDNFFILPSSLDNGLLDASLASPVSQKQAVIGVCKALKKMGFELIVIDCPPSLGTAVISTVSAADTLVIPLGNDPYSAKGLKLTLEESRAIRETFGLDEPDVRILFTRYDRRERLTEEAWNALETQYGRMLLPIKIPTSTKYAQALARKETVFASSDYRDVKVHYDQLVRHLLNIDLGKKGRGHGRRASAG